MDLQPVLRTLRERGLLDAATPQVQALPGGVSSDILRIGHGEASVCVKQALPRLKVAAEWRAPVSRNAAEVDWFETVAGFAPQSVPAVLAHAPEHGFFVMPWLDPRHYRLWKDELRAGRAQPAAAAAVGQVLGLIHARTAGDAALARRFDHADTFFDIRLHPYLLASAERHPALAGALRALSDTTAANRRALVHGDVSPKNILLGPHGPVFLDAECACYGDPAFDLAFCLNHLLLKCLWTPPARDAFLRAYRALSDAYRTQIDWEEPAALERRAARLLPGLMLARVDGKSPVEYLSAERDRQRVRTFAAALLRSPAQELAAVAMQWREHLAGGA